MRNLIPRLLNFLPDDLGLLVEINHKHLPSIRKQREDLYYRSSNEDGMRKVKTPEGL